jgi:hypothetical protein
MTSPAGVPFAGPRPLTTTARPDGPGSSRGPEGGDSRRRAAPSLPAASRPRRGNGMRQARAAAQRYNDALSQGSHQQAPPRYPRIAIAARMTTKKYESKNRLLILSDLVFY